MDFGDSHRRSITNALRYTEETLGTVEAALMSQGCLNVLHRIEDDLTPAQKEKICDCIRTIPGHREVSGRKQTPGSLAAS